MKLNNSYWGVLFQTENTLSAHFLSDHLSAEKKTEIDRLPEELEQAINAGERVYYDKSIPKDGWWKMRVDIATSLAEPARDIYLISSQVQKVVEKIKIEKIQLEWFKQIPSMSGMYIINKTEFYRFEKTDSRINVLCMYAPSPEYCKYDAYSIILNDGVMATLPNQNRGKAELFAKLLLFMEMGEISVRIVKPNEKLKYGKGGDEKIKNESGIDVTLVTTDWNKIIVVEGDFTVSQHIRIQPCGKGRSEYKMVLVKDYTKHGYLRKAASTLN